MLAVNLILSDRKTIHREYFDRGLEAAGYNLRPDGRPTDPRDLLVIWNRQGLAELRANIWEKEGGTVIVAENGYLGKDTEGRQLYAVSAHGHNGSGWFPEGPSGARGRFAELGIEVLPWREGGDYVLVCGQRGIGTRLMASPPEWHFRTGKLLERTGAMVRVRNHPGGRGAAPTTSLEQDLAGARECVIWSSSSGVKALALGIPVVYDAPHWICSAGAVKLNGGAYAVVRDDDARAAALEHMAWGQWRVAEIESGEPFVRIREAAAKELVTIVEGGQT